MDEAIIAVIVVGTVLVGMGVFFLYRNTHGSDAFIDSLRSIKDECLGIK